MRTESSRAYCLVFDDTVLAPGYHLHHHAATGEGSIVGGIAEPFLSPNDKPVLRKDDMAKLHLFWCLKRIDSNSSLWSVRATPRTHLQVNARAMLRDLGGLLQLCVQKNGTPPAVVPCDSHPTHQMSIRCMLCASPSPAETFWRDCRQPQSLKLKFFPFNALHWKTHPLFCTVDGAWSCTASMLEGPRPVPLAAYLGKDMQSDAEAAWMLNGGSRAETSWLSYGTTMMQFLMSMVLAPWHAASAMSRDQILQCALTSYYLLLLLCHRAFTENGVHWERTCFARQTLHTMVQLSANAVVRLVHWPDGLPYFPEKTDEHAIEGWFGSMKNGHRGNCNIKDGILGVDRLHLQQYKRKRTDPEPRFVQRISLHDLQQVSEQCLATASRFYAAASVDTEAQAATAALETWWCAEGQELVCGEASSNLLVEDPDTESDNEEQPAVQNEAAEPSESVDADASEVFLSLEFQKQVKQDMQNLMQPPKDSCAESLSAETLLVPAESAALVPVDGDNIAEPFAKCRMPADILKDSGLAQFDNASADEQGEMAAVKRLARLAQHCREFIDFVRLKEGFLSKAQVKGAHRELNQQQLLEHWLAEARQLMETNSQRSSRFAAWATFSQRCTDMACASDGQGSIGLSSIKQFRPPNLRSADGCQQYQLLAVREHSLAPPVLGIVTAVFRGGKKKGTTAGSRLAAEALDAAVARKVHVACLQPAGDGKQTFSCSVMSPALNILAQSDSMLLEVPPAEYVVEDTANKLTVRLSKHALNAFLQLRKGEVPNMLPENKDSKDAKPFFTAESFQGSARHRNIGKALQVWMESLGTEIQISVILPVRATVLSLARGSYQTRMYERVWGVRLVDETGRLQVKGRPDWRAFVERAPGFLVGRWTAGKKGSKGPGFGGWFMEQLRFYMPTKASDKSRLLHWFSEINRCAAKELPAVVAPG
ncbi:unnamed protein product [Symbiodinium sp. CCMP2456]|nr:unnamed protein product [Symbiodinium sp. CCMP2456]